MDEKGASDLGSTQVLLGGRVPFWSATARMWPKGTGCIRINTRSDGHAPERPNRPQVVCGSGRCRRRLSPRGSWMPRVPLNRCCCVICVGWQRAGGLPGNAPNLTVVVNHNFTRPRGSAVGVFQTFHLPMRQVPRADCHVSGDMSISETSLWNPKMSVATQARQTPKCAAHLSSQDGLCQTLEEASRWCPSAKYNVSHPCQAAANSRPVSECVDVRQISWRMPSAVMKSVWGVRA